jgi:hypothetical protein
MYFFKKLGISSYKIGVLVLSSTSIFRLILFSLQYCNDFSVFPVGVFMVKAFSLILFIEAVALSFEKWSKSTGLGRYFTLGNNDKRSGVQTRISSANF